MNQTPSLPQNAASPSPPQGAESSVFSPPPLVARDPFAEAAQRERDRAAANAPGAFSGAVIRQDWLTTAAARWAADRGIEEDPTFDPYKPEVWKELSKDIQPQYLKHFSKARSQAHASFLRELMLEKQADEKVLSDADFVGATALRLGLNLVDPSNALLAVAPVVGGMGTGVRTMARSLSRVAESGGRLSFADKALVAINQVQASRSGLVSAAVQGGAAAGLEAWRQDNSMEDSTASVAMAALLTFGLAGALGIRQARTSEAFLKAIDNEMALLQRAASDAAPDVAQALSKRQADAAEGARIAALRERVDEVDAAARYEVEMKARMGRLWSEEKARLAAERVQQSEKEMLDRIWALHRSEVAANEAAQRSKVAEMLDRLRSRAEMLDEQQAMQGARAAYARVRDGLPVAQAAPVRVQTAANDPARLRVVDPVRLKTQVEGQLLAPALPPRPTAAANDASRMTEIAARLRNWVAANEDFTARAARGEVPLREQRKKVVEALNLEKESHLEEVGANKATTKPQEAPTGPQATAAQAAPNEAPVGSPEALVGSFVEFTSKRTGETLFGEVLEILPNGRLRIELPDGGANGGVASRYTSITPDQVLSSERLPSDIPARADPSRPDAAPEGFFPPCS